MSVAKGCKLLQEIKGLNEELQNNETLSDAQRQQIQSKLTKLYAKYEATKTSNQAVPKKSKEEILKLLDATPVAELDEGTHKFVLVQLEFDNRYFHFVRAKEYAKYHYMAAEPLVERLMQVVGVPQENIEIPGGGRCQMDAAARKVFVYGYSNQYGQPPMGRVVQTIKADPKFEGWDVTYSLDGY
eukprot:Gregarina_sp_Pseudo_9__46@NODE_102_length_4267_cov_34_192526_g94_i0_p3_GENE_NODE_102_length_4267_cov_34_192526_g94_i0NODE_102_length_4267_cov_34_192526_g94_i0_p3_ORF_typecomplete_len185_score28_88Ocnus/PF05005_15/1_2e17DUF1515/PF07439_11/0_026ORF6C/PF10552_9/0_043OmpH/PF03938_14/0_24WEMBL/PF05701_11/0_27_NODE_102_length_4267_cov_34_192526_g94_i029353489